MINRRDVIGSLLVGTFLRKEEDLKEEDLKEIKQYVYDNFGKSTVTDCRISEGIKLSQRYNIHSSRIAEFIVDHLKCL